MRGEGEYDEGSRMDTALVSLAARHHLGEGWAVDATVPTGVVFHSPEDPALPSTGVAGLGDIDLGVRYELAALWGAGGYAPSVTLRLGVGLPTGTHGSARTTVGTVDIENQLRVGTGAFGASGEIRWTQFLAPEVAFAVSARARGSLSPDADGGWPGAQAAAGVDGLFFPIEWLLLRVGLEYQHVGVFVEADHGVLLNSGGHWVRADALALFRVGDVLSLGAGARVPVYTSVNGTQLAEEWGVTAVVALSLGGGGDEDEDDHDHDHHGDEHDHGHGDAHEHGAGHGDEPDHDHGAHAEEPAGDVRDVAEGGASFVLPDDVIAPGRVTVLDFWATWCHPCAHVDELLRDLAAEHPELAVRRAEAPDANCALVRDHLADDARLPQVWIFDAQGRRTDRLVGASVDEIRA